MSLTNQELYDVIEDDTEITTEITDIFLELDRTMSMTTQASLNQMLCRLYRRLASQEIVIDVLGDDPATQEQFAEWVNEEMDDYTCDLFNEEIDGE